MHTLEEQATGRADVAAYHKARLAELLERVRSGFTYYDLGEIDAFDLDEVIQRYARDARDLAAAARGN